MDRYNDAIVAFATSHGVPVLTDRDSVPADDAHYVDWAHMTDAGKREHGRAIPAVLRRAAPGHTCDRGQDGARRTKPSLIA